MDRGTIAGLMQAIAPVVRQYLGEHLAGMDARIFALESALARSNGTAGTPIPGRDGRDGKDGLGMTDAVMDTEGQLCLTRSDGALLRIGRVQGKDGRPGDPGADGVGIMDVLADGDTRKLLLTDGRVLDLGHIVGRDGAEGRPGIDGAAGVGISDVIRSGDSASIVLTDGRSLDLGRVVGPCGIDGAQGPIGRGITDAHVTEEGRLYIAYSDGTEDTLAEIRGPRGEKGDPGRDGADPDPQLIHSLVETAVAAIPPPRDGIDGSPGEKGDPGDSITGPPGDPGPQGNEGRGIVRAEQQDGRLLLTFTDGVQEDLGIIRGSNGRDGVDAVGLAGRDGIDGRSIIETSVNADGHLEVVYSDGIVAQLARVIGPQGEKGEKGDAGEPGIGLPGPPGRDGADADPELIKALVLEAASAIPQPRDGVDGEVGPPGRGIIKSVLQSGHLVVQYSDGTEDDVGDLQGPPGPPGESIKGDQGPPGKDATIDSNALTLMIKQGMQNNHLWSDEEFSEKVVAILGYPIEIG